MKLTKNRKKQAAKEKKQRDYDTKVIFLVIK